MPPISDVPADPGPGLDLYDPDWRDACGRDVAAVRRAVLKMKLRKSCPPWSIPLEASVWGPKDGSWDGEATEGLEPFLGVPDTETLRQHRYESPACCA
eukprot:522578-Pyramimonas_sp.AAC.1